VSYLFFTLAIDNSTYYVAGHLLELSAYVIVLANLLVVLRFGRQKLKNGKKAR